MDKTNAMRLLEQRRISYHATEYDPARGFHTAVEAAQMLGAPPEAVYKTLVILREPPQRGKPILLMIAAPYEVDLRLLAHELGEKKLRMATQQEAEALTGLQVGGISPLALLNRGFQILLEAQAKADQRIHLSAGVRGVDLELQVKDLIAVTGARRVRAVEPRPGEVGE